MSQTALHTSTSPSVRYNVNQREQKTKGHKKRKQTKSELSNQDSFHCSRLDQNTLQEGWLSNAADQASGCLESDRNLTRRHRLRDEQLL